jgi:hypothetical protein
LPLSCCTYDWLQLAKAQRDKLDVDGYNALMAAALARAAQRLLRRGFS